MNNQRHPIWLSALLVAVVIGSASLSIRQSSSAAALRIQKAPSAFCDVDVVRNYLSGIERLAPLGQLPQSRHLPFLPHGVSLHVIGSGLEVGPATVGFAFGDTAVNHPRRLNMWTRTTLSEVRASGVVISRVKAKTQFLGTRQIDFDVPDGQRFGISGRPGYYRLDIEFRKRTGQVLGSYSQYVRVMQPRYEANIVLNTNVVRPKRPISVRLDNLGTEPILANREITVEGFNGSEWVLVDRVFEGNRAFHGKARVYGGWAGPCVSYYVPDNAEFTQFAFRGKVTRYLKGGQMRSVASLVRVD